MTSARVLIGNTIWNAAGHFVPILVALVTIPLLIDGLGTDRFGVLALSWMVVGYFGFLDLGLGRALTKLVAEGLGRGESAEVAPLVWTALALMAVLGAVGTVLAAVLTPWLVSSVLNIPAALAHETHIAFYLLALSIPSVIVVAGLRGVLEAHQRFGVVNALRIPLSTFNFVGPAVAVVWSRRIDVIVAVLVAGRVMAALVHYRACAAVVPSLRSRLRVRRSLIGPLVRFGGWMTVSNVISPLMVYFDRFFIGGMISMSAVTYYVTPYEMVTKLTLLPSALAGVLFPAFSSTSGSAPERAAILLEKGVRYVYVVLFPVVLAVVTLAHLCLEIWLGGDFAARSTRVLQWLAAGVFVNSLAQIPFTFLQGVGRPDLTAKTHMVELPIYALSLWWAIQTFGILGASVVWVGRVVVDAVVIFAIARELAGGREVFVRLVASVGVALGLMVAGGTVGETSFGVPFVIFVLGAFLPVAWRFILGEDERARARAALGLRGGKVER